MRDAIKHIADCLGGDVNTMISTITTILIFGLGVIVNGIFKKLDKNRKRKIIRRNGLYTIKEINKLLIKQAKGYEYFSESLSYSKEPDFKLIQNANPFLEIWKMLSFEVYFDAYCSSLFRFNKKIRRKALNSVYYHLKNMENTENRAFSDFKVINEKFDKYNEDWNSNLIQISQVFMSYLNIEKKSNKEIKIIDEITPIMNDWSKIKEHWNYGLIMDLIFPKLNKLIEKFDGENQIIVISNAMSNAKFAILNIDELFDGYSKQYHNFSRNYRSSVRILAKCAEIL